MLLKRTYDMSDPERPKVNGVKVLRAGKRQHLSPELVQKAMREGWMSMAGGTITIHGEDGDVVFAIVREPGYYCCHCHKPQDGGPEARAHIRATHGDALSPDEANPAGYRKDNFYACERE